MKRPEQKRVEHIERRRGRVRASRLPTGRTLKDINGVRWTVVKEGYSNKVWERQKYKSPLRHNMCTIL